MEAGGRRRGGPAEQMRLGAAGAGAASQAQGAECAAIAPNGRRRGWGRGWRQAGRGAQGSRGQSSLGGAARRPGGRIGSSGGTVPVYKSCAPVPSLYVMAT